MKEEIRIAAKAAFEETITEKVDWIACKCYPSNLEYHVKKLAEIVAAGEKLGACKTTMYLSDEILSTLTNGIHPMRVLGMDNQIKEELIYVLTEAGIDPAIFQQFTTNK